MTTTQKDAEPRLRWWEGGSSYAAAAMTEAGKLLVLGIGNVLMGDEGLGVHVVRHLEKEDVPVGVELLDGGTGSFLLLDPIQLARKVILLEATLDAHSPGTGRPLV